MERRHIDRQTDTHEEPSERLRQMFSIGGKKAEPLSVCRGFLAEKCQRNRRDENQPLGFLETYQATHMRQARETLADSPVAHPPCLCWSPNVLPLTRSDSRPRITERLKVSPVLAPYRRTAKEQSSRVLPSERWPFRAALRPDLLVVRRWGTPRTNRLVPGPLLEPCRTKDIPPPGVPPHSLRAFSLRGSTTGVGWLRPHSSKRTRIVPEGRGGGMVRSISQSSTLTSGMHEETGGTNGSPTDETSAFVTSNDIRHVLCKKWQARMALSAELDVFGA